MNFLNGIGHFLGGLFGGNNQDDQLKKQQQQQAQQQAAQKAAAPTPAGQLPTPSSTPAGQLPAAPMLNLFQGNPPLQKMTPRIATPTPSPSLPAPSSNPTPLLADNQPLGSTLTKAAPSFSDLNGPEKADSVAQFTKPIVDAGGNMVHSAVQIASTPVNLIRAGLAKITGNKAAQDSAMAQAGQGYNAAAGVLQAVPDTAARMALSANPLTDPKKQDETYHPNSPLEKVIFGSNPIDSYATQYNKAIKSGASPATAAGGLVATVGGDVLAGEGLKGGVTKLTKANSPVEAPSITESASETPTPAETTPQPNEVAPGVKSSNPNRAADAAAQVEAANPTPPPAPEPAPIVPHVFSPEEANTLNTLDTAAKNQILKPDEKALRSTLQAKKDAIDQANNPEPTPTPTVEPTQADAAQAVAEGQPVIPPTAVDANGNQMLTSAKTDAQAAEAAGVSPQAAPVVLPSELPADARTAPNAPRQRAAAIKNLGDVAKGTIKTAGDEHAVYSNPELTDAGKAVSDTMSDPEIVQKYTEPTTFNSAKEVAIAKADRDRLASIMRNSTPEERVAAQNSLNNLVDAAANVTSKHARTVNYAQEMLDGMPPEAKAAYYIKQIDKANAGRLGEDHPTLAADPARANEVNGRFTQFLTKDEQLKSEMAAQSSILDKATSPETNASVSVDDVKQAAANLKSLDEARKANNGEMVKYYDSLTPGRTVGEKAGDWQRTAMLSSPEGRVHAMIGTTFNAADHGVKSVVSGIAGRLHNLVTAPDKAVRDRGVSLGATLKGAYTGLKKTYQEAKGNFQVDSPDKFIKDSSAGNSSQMSVFGGGKVKQVVNAATHLHSNLTEGIRGAELVRDARTEGLKQGLSGEDLDKFTVARAAQPDRAMQARADQVHSVVNNLNKNGISDVLEGVTQAITSKIPGPIGTTIKNQVMPFPRFLGGHMFNVITDKNVVAAGIKTINSALKGDMQGFIDNASSLGVEGGKTYALGYLLTQNGVLTNTDANGKSYDGVYVHIGNRYIPATTFGFFAPSLVLGNALYTGFHDPNTPDAGVADKIMKTAANALGSSYKAFGLSDALGAGTSITGPIGNAFSGNNNNYDGSKLLKVATAIAGQNIPAITGDVNAALNYTGLNPTHEAAQTTVKETNPTTGNQKTNSWESAKAFLANKIPLLSQTLPRQTGVAAQDGIDRMLASTQDTPTTVQARAAALTKAQLSAQDKANDIPDPNAKYTNGDSFDSAVQARIDRGEYDKAIAGYQQKLDSYNGDKNVSKSTTDKLANNIKEVQVLKNGNFPPAVRDLYGKTSLGEWRNMGDPTNDAYDQKTYDLLYTYDLALAKSGVSANTTSPSDAKYQPKAPAKGSSKNSGASLIKSNTLSSPTQSKMFSFGNLSPQKVSAANTTMPTVPVVQPGDLIKARAISVHKA